MAEGKKAEELRAEAEGLLKYDIAYAAEALVWHDANTLLVALGRRPVDKTPEKEPETVGATTAKRADPRAEGIDARRREALIPQIVANWLLVLKGQEASVAAVQEWHHRDKQDDVAASTLSWIMGTWIVERERIPATTEARIAALTAYGDVVARETVVRTLQALKERDADARIRQAAAQRLAELEKPAAGPESQPAGGEPAERSRDLKTEGTDGNP